MRRFAFLALALAACEKSSEDPVEGTWSGVDESGFLELRLSPGGRAEIESAGGKKTGTWKRQDVRRVQIDVAGGPALLEKNGDVLTLSIEGRRVELRRGSDPAALRTTCRHLIDNLSQACGTYRADLGAYPAHGRLGACLKQAGPKKLAYFEFRDRDLDADGNVLDPWGRPLRYSDQPRGKSPLALWSVGPDGIDQDGEGDDVCNWK